MAILKYPADLDTGKNDFIKFDHFEYQVNQRINGGPGLGGGPTLNQEMFPPSRKNGNTIVLYMPNSTPAQHYGHETTYQTFPGPFGAVGKQILSAAGAETFTGAGENLAEIIKGAGAGATAGGAVYQFAVQQAASFFGADAATAIAIGQGKLFNPNAEMIYKQPFHRKYNFTFDFVPKSAAESRAVDDIIFEFKKWSAPSDAEKNFMKIPDLWRISYHQAGGGTFKRMNLFLPSMITNFVAQDNPSSNFHMTVADESGHVPVHTAINIFFQETMPPTRSSHDEFARSAGHLRGL